jgi:hypothetical protein
LGSSGVLRRNASLMQQSTLARVFNPKISTNHRKKLFNLA